MIQFLENSKPIFTSDREDLIEFYTSQGYEVCPILYNSNFLNPILTPIWNGTDFVESATPEEIAEANKPIVQNLKLEQCQELSPTDWYYTRYIETGQEVPLEIKQQRQEIRDKYNNLIENINNE